MPLKLCQFVSRGKQIPNFKTLNPCNGIRRYAGNEPGPSRVAVFWDLDNKPPKSTPPYEAALKLRAAAASFGIVRYMVAYANRHAFSHVPRAVTEERREVGRAMELENRGLIRPVEPHLCRVCGRRFYNHEKMMNHFQIHERENRKRANQIESARGKRRLKFVERYAVKMDKYRKAARGVLIPKVGYGLGDELKRAGVLVRMVDDAPQAADVALRAHIVDMMDKRGADCLVLVSDDSDFVEVVEEARLRCLKTVVVGDVGDGALRRVADAGFSWPEVLRGKAKKEAGSVVGRWKDKDVLKRLEWSFNLEEEKRLSVVVGDCDADDCQSEEGADRDAVFEDDDGCLLKEDTGCWWELESDNATSS